MLKDKIYNLYKKGNGREYISSVLVVVAIIITAGIVMATIPPKQTLDAVVTKVEKQEKQAKQEEVRHPLTGELTEKETHPPLYAVIVENSLDAWPQSGIEDAFLIIEAPVEGNITRWLTFYSGDKETDKIGPVRSARPYFVEWALGFDSLFAHVGGSPEGLALVKSTGLTDLDEFFHAKRFWRSTARYAPHNTYTETERLKKAWDQAIDREQNYEPILFKAPEQQDTDTETEVADKFVDFAHKSYNVTWKYNKETNTYIRWQYGKKHKTKSGKTIQANTVAIIETNISTIDNIGRKRIRTKGEGIATILKNGKEITAIWKRPTNEDQIKFYDSADQQIPFNPGQTWIEVISE